MLSGERCISGTGSIIACYLFFLLFPATGFTLAQSESQQDPASSSDSEESTGRPRVEIPYEEEVLVVTADSIEADRQGQIRAQGQVVATYEDAVLKADTIVYSEETGQIEVEGELELVRGGGWIRGSRAELDIEARTGTIHDAYGFVDQTLYIRAEKFIRLDETTYLAEEGFVTSCEESVPKWSFSIRRAKIHLEGTARLSGTVFRVKRVPLFYFPYLILPTEDKERSSGFLLPSIGNSNSRGRRLTNRFYLVLGRSADVTLQQDYYSKRGYGGGFDLRTRPNAATQLDLLGEFVDDRKGQGGASLTGIGQTRFGNGFRGVADFNLVSNFRFRQAFSDNFFTATQPTEDSRLFVTNNFRSIGFSALVERQETVFPDRNAVTQNTPGLNFRLLGRRLGPLPIYFDLDSSMAGVNRSDPLIETPRMSQRIDLFPRIYFSVPLFQGLRLTPRLGLRETFYSDSLVESDEGLKVTGESLRREYLDLSVDLKGWGLSKIYGEGESRWKHLVEPQARYRLIRGIDEPRRIIRFDALDAIAETSEFEVGLVNRFFTKAPGGGVHEWMSIKLAQKRYFDSTFGGAIQQGSINQFFPLNDLTGLPYALGPRDYSPLTGVLRLNPSRRFSFDVTGDYDIETGDVRRFSVTGFYRREQFNFSTTYFVTEELIEGLGRANQVQGRFGIGDPDRGLSTLAGFSYDARETRLLNHLVRVNYFWDCCGVSFELRGFDLQSRDENQIRFSFYLKGIGAFGTIRRPENVF